MNATIIHQQLTENLHYSCKGQSEAYSLPFPLQDSLQLIEDFFANNTTNKLCLVFPSKEFSAQWLSVPTVLFLIENDYKQYKKDIIDSYRDYKIGDRLKLNGDAIVDWAGVRNNSVAFKAGKEPNTAIFTIDITQSIKLQRTEQSRQLSSIKRVKNALPGKIITPTDKLLEINTYGNKEFMKNKICLVSKFKLFDESFDDIVMNNYPLPEYFQGVRIDENGELEINSPLIITNNLSSLAIYATLSASSISKIIIDGFATIQERGTDFSDIDALNIPTILITDLSEIESFETLSNYGFEFFNFTRESLQIDNSEALSPFYSFESKLKKYISFNVTKEICKNEELEETTREIHSIERDEYNSDLNNLIIHLIKLTNHISRIAHIPTTNEISVLKHKLLNIETLFLQCKMWLGDSNKPIENSIILLKSIIKKLALQPFEKCDRLNFLLAYKQFDYIICSTEEEANALEYSLSSQHYKLQVISVADVNDKILTNQSIKAIITGWANSKNINKILSSFLFSEITLLLYPFEKKYYDSLQKRNRQYSDKVSATINRSGFRTGSDYRKEKGFSDLYSVEEWAETASESNFDILDFEIKLDNVQYSRFYAAKENISESIRAKRMMFESDLFIYASESHKFLVINDVIKKVDEKANLHRRRVESLQPGDVIALINTDRDILVELVDNSTNTKDLAAVKQWTELWKNLLKDYYASIGSDFKKLVRDLRTNDCKKHEVTIRTWLQDESKIGPDDNSDLISIALLTNSNLLNDNIDKVREAIRKMTGWRMKASDFITDKIKAQIHQFADNSIINKKISVEGLGSVIVLKVIEVSSVWENIDVRFVNRLLQKEII